MERHSALLLACKLPEPGKTMVITPEPMGRIPQLAVVDRFVPKRPVKRNRSLAEPMRGSDISKAGVDLLVAIHDNTDIAFTDVEARVEASWQHEVIVPIRIHGQTICIVGRSVRSASGVLPPVPGSIRVEIELRLEVQLSPWEGAHVFLTNKMMLMVRPVSDLLGLWTKEKVRDRAQDLHCCAGQFIGMPRVCGSRMVMECVCC